MTEKGTRLVSELITTAWDAGWGYGQGGFSLEYLDNLEEATEKVAEELKAYIERLEQTYFTSGGLAPSGVEDWDWDASDLADTVAEFHRRYPPEDRLKEVYVSQTVPSGETWTKENRIAVNSVDFQKLPVRTWDPSPNRPGNRGIAGFPWTLYGVPLRFPDRDPQAEIDFFSLFLT